MNSTTSLKEPPAEGEDKTQVKEDPNKVEEDMEDPLPKKLQATVNARLKNDVIVCTFLGLFVLGLHCTTVFTTLTKQQLNTVSGLILPDCCHHYHHQHLHRNHHHNPHHHHHPHNLSRFTSHC